MNDDQLIFLVSLPRSGSTMLQKMLGEHSSIYTRSESWLMLPLLSLRSKQIFETKYDHSLASKAVVELMDCCPQNVEDKYRQCVRDFALDIYGTYATSRGKKYFLDKTPRYHLVIDELRIIFPRAKFIVLYRNPLAILSSIVKSWLIDDYDELLQFQVDLVEGLDSLSRVAASTQVMKVKYEDLLEKPEELMQEICSFVGIGYEPRLVEYGDKQSEEWAFGDKNTVNTLTHPIKDKIDSWESGIVDTRLRALLAQYLTAIGKKRFERFGYSFDRHQDLLRSHESDEPATTIICGMRANQFFDFEVEDIASRGYYSAVTIYKRAHREKMQTEARLLASEVAGLERSAETLAGVQSRLDERDEQLLKLQRQLDERNVQLAELERRLVYEQQQTKNMQAESGILRDDIARLDSINSEIGRDIEITELTLKEITDSRRFRLIMGAMYPIDKLRDLVKG